MKSIRKYQIIRAGFIAFLLFAATQVFATEYNVNGCVINTQDEPIKNAVVTITDTKTHTPVANALCNAKGNFSLSDVPEGEYIITVYKGRVSRAKAKNLKINSDGSIMYNNIENAQNSENDLLAIK